MSEWAKIVEAVKEPIALAALSLLVLMAVLRQVVAKIGPIRGESGHNLARTVVNTVGTISLVVAIGAIAYKFYGLNKTSAFQNRQLESSEKLELSKLSASQTPPPMTRIGMEDLLQKHRASIEECLDQKPKTLYLDFVVRNGKDKQLNVDVFDGVTIAFASAHPLTFPAGVYPRSGFPNAQDLEGENGSPPPAGDVYFVTGDLIAYPDVTVASARKMSVSDPKANGCILDILRDSLSTSSPPKEPFTHRYITNQGVRASREFRGAYSEQIDFALEEGRFDDAKRLAAEASKSGYQVSLDGILPMAKRQYALMKSGKISQDVYEDRIRKMQPDDIVK